MKISSYIEIACFYNGSGLRLLLPKVVSGLTCVVPELVQPVH